MNLTARTGDWMQTFTGRLYWPIDPRADELDIVDIAHALSNTCRYGGHCRRFYSVAEHSVLVSQVVPPVDAKHGLMHDATEAYCTDVPRPLKRHLSNYAAIEQRNWLAICERFGLAADMPDSVKIADDTVLLTEKIALMEPQPMPWNIPGAPADVLIRCLPPEEARALFLARFFTLFATPPSPQ